VKKASIAVLSVAAVALSYVLYIFITDNVHTVIQGQIYRSGQQSVAELTQFIEQKHIRSVLNLRGFSWQPWFAKEKQTAAKLKVNYYSIHISPHDFPPLDRLKNISQIILTAPKPLLIHCKNGADRTGFASALALIVLQNASFQQAKKQYSWLYLAVSPSSVGKLLFPRYQNWLQENNQASSKKAFLAWLDTLTVGKNYPDIYVVPDGI